MNVRTQIPRLLLAAAVCLAAFLLFMSSGMTYEELLLLIPSGTLLAAIILVGVHCAKSLLMFIPRSVLHVVTGMLFPPATAILLAYIGLAAEIGIGYALGQHMGQAQVSRLVQKRPRAAAVIDLLESSDSTVSFFARLIPLPLPIDAVSMLSGAFALPFAPYLFYSLLGLSGTMLPAVLLGTVFTGERSLAAIFPCVISFALCLTLFFLSRYIRGRASSKS